MLERVALNQTRFHVPGLVPDARGIAFGPKLGLLFASVDRLVGFFRIYLEQASIDDVLPTLRIYGVRTPVAGQELLLTFQAESSYVADRAARIGRLVGALAFTGAGKHFVQYRDEASPLGYDTTELITQQAGDFFLYAESFSQGYARTQEIGFAQLLFRLALVPVPGRADLSAVDTLYLSARRGLGAMLVHYLWRNRIECAAAACNAAAVGGTAGTPLLLVRTGRLPQRMVELFLGVPGLTLFRSGGDNFAVEVGYRHPIALESCAGVFDKDRFFLFCGGAGTVESFKGPIEFASGDACVALSFDLARDRRAQEGTSAESLDSLRVALKLVPSSAPPRRVSAALLPVEHREWLRKLVYALPPSLLRGHRIAAAAGHLVLTAQGGLDAIPLGLPMQELAPNLFVPIGYELVPRVSSELLSQHVGAGPSRLVFFTPFRSEPVAIEAESFLPLERQVLAQASIARARPEPGLTAPAAAPVPEVDNREIGPFDLWGFSPTRKT